MVLTGEGGVLRGGRSELDAPRGALYEEQNYEDALRLARLFESIVQCPALVVARVRGAAFGGGCGLVAAADVAVAEEGDVRVQRGAPGTHPGDDLCVRGAQDRRRASAGALLDR